jgi:hypothetical protein
MFMTVTMWKGNLPTQPFTPGMVIPCRECGRPCRVVPVTLRDGSREVAGIYCDVPGCRLNPPNRFDQRFCDVPHHTVSLMADKTFLHRAVGRPDQGEDNVMRVANVFLTAGNRDHGLDLVDEIVVSDGGATEDGIDCRLRDRAGQVFALQVTRALPTDFYSAQGRHGQHTASVRPTDAALLLRAAIERKRPNASQAVHLVLDGTQALELSFLSEQLLVADHRDWLEQQGWRAIWVVGPTWLKRLA